MNIAKITFPARIYTLSLTIVFTYRLRTHLIKFLHVGRMHKTLQNSIVLSCVLCGNLQLCLLMNSASYRSAPTTSILVFISSSRLAQASLTVSLCWAMVAASECPVPINWSQTSLVFASRSLPIFVVSCLKSSNFWINIYKLEY